jgi:hypothetical protein
VQLSVMVMREREGLGQRGVEEDTDAEDEDTEEEVFMNPGRGVLRRG